MRWILTTHRGRNYYVQYSAFASVRGKITHLSTLRAINIPRDVLKNVISGEIFSCFFLFRSWRGRTCDFGSFERKIRLSPAWNERNETSPCSLHLWRKLAVQQYLCRNRPYSREIHFNRIVFYEFSSVRSSNKMELYTDEPEMPPLGGWAEDDVNVEFCPSAAAAAVAAAAPPLLEPIVESAASAAASVAANAAAEVAASAPPFLEANIDPSAVAATAKDPVPPIIPQPDTNTDAARKVFALCKEEKWAEVSTAILADPSLAIAHMTMANNITTTIMHQAITSKGDVASRAALVKSILSVRPDAASIKNGYGSLPLHVLAQRNCKMKSATKEELIITLIDAYPKALVTVGGVGLRTPLHIAFTDYISPKLVKRMIDGGLAATKIKDKKGWLPIHVACSRHASPEKMRMLLAAYPESLHERNGDGKSLLELARSTATKSHPNKTLIKFIVSLMEGGTALSSPKKAKSKREMPSLPPSTPDLISPNKKRPTSRINRAEEEGPATKRVKPSPITTAGGGTSTLGDIDHHASTSQAAGMLLMLQGSEEKTTTAFV